MSLTVTAKDYELGFKSSHPGLSLCSYPHHKQRHPVTAAATKAVKDAGDTLCSLLQSASGTRATGRCEAWLAWEGSQRSVWSCMELRLSWTHCVCSAMSLSSLCIDLISETSYNKRGKKPRRLKKMARMGKTSRSVCYGS